MDWTLAIEKNREALKRVLAMLVAMVGVASCGSEGGQFTFFPHKGSDASGQAQAEKSKLSPAPTLPRHLHRFVLRLLRPAEAAARRLIIVAARGLVVELTPPRASKPKPRSVFVRSGVGTGIVLAPGSPLAVIPSRPATLAFPLFDPLKPWGTRRHVNQRSVPRISFFDTFDRPRSPMPLPPSPDDWLDAGRLHRRLEAIGRALDDLPRVARRLARWKAHRDAAAAQNGTPSVPIAGRVQRFSPMRPGRPPGWRRQPAHVVDDILNELHGLAVWARERPDTS